MVTLRCELCPKFCSIPEGCTGECRVRANLDGTLRALTFGRPCAAHVDPVEKKPLYHFLPGSHTFSLATVGCNLHCRNCQNWEISQADPEAVPAYVLPPKEVARQAAKNRCRSVAYTYTDPVIYYEYALSAAQAAGEQGLRNVLVTAAYANPGPWRTLCRAVDAANIDLKAMSESFYREICGATLQPVLRALAIAREEGVHVEVTNLVIPTLNDSDSQVCDLCRWVVAHLGQGTPLHFSRFVPRYRLRNLPPTPAATLLRAREIARAAGLEHVYVGNLRVPGAANTLCPGCGRMLVEREGYSVQRNDIERGRCPTCQTEVQGRWE